MNFFTALALPPELAQQLISIAPLHQGIRLVEPPDLHITLRFLGTLEPKLYEEIKEAFLEIQAPQIPIQLKGSGCFSEGTQPKILWIGVEKNPPLIELHQKIGEVLDRFKIAHDRRAYFPHVTLAKLDNAPAELLSEFLAQHYGTTWEGFTSTYWGLYQSHYSKTSAHYEEKEVYQLGDTMDFLLG
jgi:2'-5' RNA ligase